MTVAQFTDIFGLLAVQLRFTEADEAVIRGYFAALQDLEPELVALAAQRFGRGAVLNDKGEAWFPKAPEWRALAGKIEGERTELQRSILRKLKEPLCTACNDTGWEAVNSSTETRWRHCGCRVLRRLEVLGRRPMPALTA